MLSTPIPSTRINESHVERDVWEGTEVWSGQGEILIVEDCVQSVCRMGIDQEWRLSRFVGLGGEDDGFRWV